MYHRPHKTSIFLLILLVVILYYVPPQNNPILSVKADTGSLIYDSHYENFSSTVATTNSTSLVDDPQASLDFSLSGTYVVLVLYSAGKNYPEDTPDRGQTIGINVDDSDVALQSQSSPTFDPVYATVFWVGTLESGSHTIKGRFKRDYAGTYDARIDIRRLTAIIFQGNTDDFKYVRSTTAVSTSSGSLIDDTQAMVTFTPTSACKALILYAACNYYGATQHNSGKHIAIQVDAVDGTVKVGHTPQVNDYPDHSFIAEIRNLTQAEHTIKGRFASNFDTYSSRISERQLAVLLFSSSLETDFVESTALVSTTSSAYADDTYANVERTISDTRLIFSIYSACFNGTGAGITNHGMDIAISIDGTDYVRGGSSPFTNSYRNSGSVHSGLVEKDSGTYVVKGRFRGANYGDAPTYKINQRTLCVLWFSISGEGQTYTVSLSKSINVDYQMATVWTAANNLALSNTIDFSTSKTWSSAIALIYANDVSYTVTIVQGQGGAYIVVLNLVSQIQYSIGFSWDALLESNFNPSIMFLMPSEAEGEASGDGSDWTISSWINIAVPRGYVAMTIVSLIVIVAVGFALMKRDWEEMVYIVGFGIGIIITAWIVIVMLGAFEVF